MKILNLIPASDLCGWGIAGHNLSKQLPSFCEIVTEPADCDVVLAPVSNHDWGYAIGHETIGEARRLRKPIIGYAFHEWDIAGRKNIYKLPENYTGLLCGSYWMEEWVRLGLHDAGFEDFHVSTALQGVNYDIFNADCVKHRPKEVDGKFVVISGGKFEYRKGQDIVIEAFKKFYRNAPDSILLFAWGNPWPQTALSMKESKYITLEDIHLIQNSIGAIDVHHVDEKLIPLDRQYSFAMDQNVNMPALYGSGNIGIFPSRCEAGTNLVAMEALACGLPSLISDCSGHTDLIYKVDDVCSAIPVQTKKLPVIMEDGAVIANWDEACVDKIVSELMKAYKKRDKLVDRTRGSYMMQTAGFTWENCAKSIVALCERVK